ncbi:MAG TPA: hypothetical protein VHB25_08525 [Gemmatimonadaceae bacterium]|nr:hypothetical protein [Gemmatimonadaceae bacterium]
MSAFSTLYRCAAQPTMNDGTGAQIADPRQHHVGGDCYHGQPGTHLPDTATVLRDGTTAWTWNDVALELTDSERAAIVPHRWDDEPTDSDLDVTQWPLLTPPPQ